MLPISIVLKPALLGVALWKKAADMRSPKFNSPNVAELKLSNKKVRKTRLSLIVRRSSVLLLYAKKTFAKSVS